MGVLSSSVGLACLLIIYSAAQGHIIRENGCPSAQVIEPCTCYYNTALECTNIHTVETLRTVFENSDGYSYSQINISSSSLQYLPHDMFESVPVRNLILHSVALDQLFDSPPDGLENLESLLIENTQISRRMTWDLLEPFTNLRLLTVYFNSIRVLDTTFSHYITKNLQQLIFYGTETKRIKPGVLVDFVNLNRVAFEACQLTTITRDVFPRPFNVQVLQFKDNRITSIPDNLFTDMPNLQTLDLRNNLISVLPESSFDGNMARITYAWFDGNPLKCDCLLKWIINEKPYDLRGHCAAPKRVHRKYLKDLEAGDFNC